MKHRIFGLALLMFALLLSACSMTSVTDPTTIEHAEPTMTTAPDESTTVPPLSPSDLVEALPSLITDPVSIHEMSDNELTQLAKEVFTCSRMPSNMEWPELVALADRSTSSLAFLIENANLGINISGATAMNFSLPLKNLEEEQICVANLPQWMSYISSCFERSYGSPIWWSMWSDPEEDRKLQLVLTHMDSSLLYSYIAEYTGNLMEAYPALPVFEELPDSATAPDFLMGRDDPRLLKVGQGPWESFLVSRTKLHLSGDDAWCEFTPVYGDNRESWFTPLSNLSIPIFSTEFVECDENTLHFLEMWASPVVG